MLVWRWSMECIRCGWLKEMKKTCQWRTWSKVVLYPGSWYGVHRFGTWLRKHQYMTNIKAGVLFTGQWKATPRGGKSTPVGAISVMAEENGDRTSYTADTEMLKKFRALVSFAGICWWHGTVSNQNRLMESLWTSQVQCSNQKLKWTEILAISFSKNCVKKETKLYGTSLPMIASLWLSFNSTKKEDRGQYTFARGEPITTLKSLETLNFLIDALDALHEKHGLVSLSLDELAVFVTQAPEALKGLDSYRHPWIIVRIW